jgi:gamma-glutamyltranspeptidase/glutathione hydrolase
VKFKRVFAGLLSVVVACVIIGGVLYYFTNRDPTPIKVDPKLYDAYAGNYDFGNNYILTIRRDGNRLISHAPERLDCELLPETETKFFVRNEPVRFVFRCDEQGLVESLIAQWKNGQETAKKLTDIPVIPIFTNGILAATTGGEAIQAGLDILKEGGSAADAAMATALCHVTHAGGSYVSFAGLMVMLYYDAAGDQVHFLDAQFQLPLGETDPSSIPKTGGRTALVPGFMAGVEAAHTRFGKLPFARIVQPAIALAEKGEPVSPSMAWWINSKKSVLSRLPETKQIFTKPDGKFYGEGDLFRQPALAATLKKVAADGAAYMYGGDWGRKFVQVIQKNGGKITLQDMTNYQARWEPPLQTIFRDYKVFAPSLRTWGGVNNIEALNLLELADLRKSGPYTSSPHSLFWLMQIAECHKLTWNHQDVSGRDLSRKSRATKETSAWIWSQLTNGTWPRLPEGMRKRASNHSDAIVVADQWGNMAVIGHTIGTGLWGNTGIFVDGISIPDPAATQQRQLAQVGSGNRVPIGMNPLIMLHGGKPFLGSSATGAGLHYKTLQTLANILDQDMAPQEAVDTPAFLPNGVEAGTFDPKLLQGVKRLGMKVNVLGPKEAQPGYWVGVQVDPTTRRLRGGTSRGAEGQVVGF